MYEASNEGVLRILFQIEMWQVLLFPKVKFKWHFIFWILLMLILRIFSDS